MACYICGRADRGFGWGRTRKFCSMRCQKINNTKEKTAGENTMIDPTEKELIAVDSGGALGGEYLESIEKYDLSKLSPIEYHTYIRCIVQGFTESLVAQEQAVNTLNAAGKKK